MISGSTPSLLVLGASGGIGQQLVAQAAARGHRVTAVARRPLSVPPSARLRLAEVDRERPLDGLIDGHEVVISALGLRRRHVWNPWSALQSPPDLMGRLAGPLAEAMRRTGVTRLFAVSAAGVGEGGARLPAPVRAMLDATQIGVSYADLAVMEGILLGSGLDVCCVRPTVLTDGPATGRAAVVSAIGARAWVRRADVAAWILDHLTADLSVLRTPTISAV
jgi:putative NADH-flavin reductase